MIIQCRACSKIKKFGEWIEIPEALHEVIKDVNVTTHTLCPHCQGNVLSMPSLDKVMVKRVGTKAVDTISLR